MKKQLAILSAFTILSSPWAMANDDEIIIRPLPPIQSEQNLRSSDNSSASEQRSVIRTYQYIKHVDLRDISKYDKEMEEKLPDSADRLPGTSRKILQAISENPSRFAGADVIYYENGAKGPSGKSSFVSERARNEFVISKRYPETQTNTIFSADYISAVEVAPSVIEAKLLLFIHSNSQGYYFRKLTVKVDWKKNKTHGLEDVVSVLSLDQDIALTDTDFQMKGSISDQKIILEDQASGIIKVFPVTVGAIDARTESVESMTFWVPERQRQSAKTEELKAEFQDFSNSALVKRDFWTTGFNTAERLYPSYYKGRPFIALVDLNYVESEPNFSAGYREIGLHYQITEPGLERGMKSHGCVRVRDKDLYQLDAILNHGPKNTIASSFKKTLPNYEDIDHPHTHLKTYSKVAYTNFQSEVQGESIACKYRNADSIQSRKVRWNTSGKFFHTIIDEDCLTKVFKTNNPYTEVKDFWNNVPGAHVEVHMVDVEHSPVTNARKKLLEYNYHPETIDAMDHKQRLKTLFDIKSGVISVNTSAPNDNFSSNDFNQPVVIQPTVSTWPSYGITGNTIGNSRYQTARGKKERGLKLNSNEERNYWVHLYYKNCIRDPNNPISNKSCGLIHQNIQRYLR